MSLTRTAHDTTDELADEIKAVVDKLRLLSHDQLVEMVVRSNLAGLNIELDTKDIDLPVNEFWAEIDIRIQFLIDHLGPENTFFGKMH